MGAIGLISGSGCGMGERKRLLKEWEEEAYLEAGSKPSLWSTLQDWWAVGQRGGKVSEWVRARSCLLKGPCHRPPQTHSLTLVFQMHAYLLRAGSTGALGNKGTGWSCSWWRPLHGVCQGACHSPEKSVKSLQEHSLLRASVRHEALLSAEPSQHHGSQH